jgi:hypothetical protein
MILIKVNIHSSHKDCVYSIIIVIIVMMALVLIRIIVSILPLPLHVSFDERGSVCEAAGGMHSFHFDVPDPLHFLEVEHSQAVREGVGRANLADGAVVAAEEDETAIMATLRASLASLDLMLGGSYQSRILCDYLMSLSISEVQ